MLISGKGKYFSVFGCISKNFPENIFWCLEKKKEKTNPRKISSTIAIRDRDLAGAISQSTARARDGAISRSTRRELVIDASRDRAVDRSLGRRRDRDLATARDRTVDREIVIFTAIVGLEIDAAWSSESAGNRRTNCSVSSPLARALSLSLSLSLFFRKCFEVKMRGENYFRVKGENIGQPEVIFRKILFSVTAKHAENGENDFLKSFSPKTNAPVVTK